MTEEKLALAERLRAWHAQRFGYANVRFLQEFIERLDALGLEANSFDVVVSNCVLNLSPDKEAVLSAVWQLLKPGGEFYFSDVYADRRLPRELQSDPVLYGECLAGALYENDFLRMARAAGFTDPRLVRQRAIDIRNAELAARVTGVRFRSATYRLFKLEGLEDACEDYGQAVIYRGSIPEYPDCFPLDTHHEFERGRVTPVCGNTWRMLSQTRLAPHFECIGNLLATTERFAPVLCQVPKRAGGATT
jgi:SAM-dependent methyltransferase